MTGQYSLIGLLTLALVFGVPRFNAELHDDSYATVAANGGSLVERPTKEQIAPDEEAYIDDPGEGVLKTPKHPWDADRISLMALPPKCWCESERSRLA
jgi:hypothetical protein